jgi:hypothetical protein
VELTQIARLDSAATGPEPIPNIIAFAGGERVSAWCGSALQFIDTSNASVTMSFDAQRTRLWALEPDGPLFAVLNGPETKREVELWNVLTTTKIATLLAVPDGVSFAAPMLTAGGFAMIRYVRAPGAPRDGTIVRWDRTGRALSEIPIARGGHEIFGGVGAPSMFWDVAFGGVVSVDFDSGARTPLESDPTEPARPPAVGFHWTRDASRDHLARFSRGARSHVWNVLTGARVRGRWEEGLLRYAFFAGDALCAVRLDSTFVTYAINGDEIARGGLATREAEHPRPAFVDDRHLVTVLPDARGVAVWDVHRGVEVARLENIEGLGEVTLLTGRGGRLALSDGANIALFDVRRAA